MSQLYFTSSYGTERLLSLEQLFERINPREIVLVFDTNIVIDFREFYFDPQKYSTDINRQSVYFSIRYLVEQINRYDLEVNASFGTEESSRSINNFELNSDKAKQTHRAVQCLFKMDLYKLDNHIMTGSNEDAIKSIESFPDSKINCLSTDSTFKDLLTYGYLVSLKLYDLLYQIEKKSKPRMEAMKELLTFLDEEAGGVATSFISFAFYVFGGYNDLRSLIYSSNKEPNKKLHKIFNGAIDLIYPLITDFSQEIFKDQELHRKLTPVFVTRDKHVSILHSIIKVEAVLDETKIPRRYTSISFEYLDKTSWSKNDIQMILIEIGQLNERRINKDRKSWSALIESVGKYEIIVKSHFHQES